MATTTSNDEEYTTVELLTLSGPEHRRVSKALPRPATREEIPIIDLYGMNYDDISNQDIAMKVRAAAMGSGFFYISNHGIPNDVIAAALQQAKLFFALPEGLKSIVLNSKSKHGNGWSGVSTSQINSSEGKDQKESFLWFYQTGLDPLHDGDPFTSLDVLPGPQGEDSVWEALEPILPGFKAATVTWWQHCLALARNLIEIIAIALDLPETYFDDMTVHPGADGLYIHYPGTNAASSDAKPNVGLGSHTDMQVFTLLWQDDSGGLQVLSRDEWLEAPPIEGTLVVNIADFLQRLSNDRFKSTVHRVFNRQPGPRYSMPFFFGFDYDVVCGVVPTCVDEGHPAKYEPTSCGKWREERMKLARAMAKREE